MILGNYINGNIKVILLSNGTKIRIAENGAEPNALFPENIDIKLTNYCNIGCLYCHEDSNINNKFNPEWFKLTFFKTLRRGTEVALGGGALSSLPRKEFKEFLYELKNQGVIPNITVNQKEIENINFMNFLQELISEDLVYGIGVSFKYESEILKNFVIKYRERIVIHVINGLITKDELEYLSTFRPKILILGYKNLRRGVDYFESTKDFINENMDYLSSNIKSIRRLFKTMSFDCLAVEQLNIKNKISKNEWDTFYMGDDGSHTMYIDIPNMKFAKSSTANFNERYELLDNIDDMFNKIKTKEEHI